MLPMPVPAQVVDDLFLRLEASPLAGARADAAEALGRRGADAPEGSAAVLRRALADSDSDVRRAAIRALSAVGGDPADNAAALANAIRDPDWMVRESAAKAFATIGAVPEATVTALGEALDATDPSVRYAAASALAAIGPGAAAHAPRLAAIVRSDEDWQPRFAAARALGRIGPSPAEVVPALLDAVRYDEPQVAEAAVEALARLSAVRPSAAALSDPFANMTWDSARVLGFIGATAAEAAPDLAALVAAPDEHVRWDVVWALRSIGGAEVLPALERALDDDAWRIRWIATRALGDAGPGAREAVPELARLLADPDSRVCEAAAFALEAVGPDARLAVPAMLEQLAGPVPDTCEVVDTSAATGAVLMEDRWTVRWAIARALGTVGGEGAVPALAGALRDDNWQVRGIAALSLGRLGGPDAIGALSDVLDDSSAAVRKAAAAALGLIGPEAAALVPALERMSSDEEEMVRAEAVRALERIRSE